MQATPDWFWIPRDNLGVTKEKAAMLSAMLDHRLQNKDSWSEYKLDLFYKHIFAAGLAVMWCLTTFPLSRVRRLGMISRK